MTGLPGSSVVDPRTTLRSYRGRAPWRLRDLASLASALLERADVTPVSSAAKARPTERTIRFYVARGLVNPPDGRGTSATYSYRHLLQVLAIKLRQMEGATLERLAQEFRDMPGDVLEHRVASALGPSLPPPDALSSLQTPSTERRPNSTRPDGLPGKATRRLILAPGVELLIDESHPAWQDPGQLAILSARVVDAMTAFQRQYPEQ